MKNSVATIECSYPHCQASNPLDSTQCHKCQTPLIRRYLWAIGDWIKVYRVGELIEDRYLLKHPKIVLDTKPALAPQAPDEFPSYILPYLKLFPYRLHVPQVYSHLPSPDPELNLEIWFLEYGTVPTDPKGELKYPDFLPQLSQVWAEGTAIKQLHWLWQMARLWQPLHSQGVTASLLDPSLLRVNGSFIQLLELQPNFESMPSLSQLGQLWSEWVDSASPTIEDFLQGLCQNLRQEQIQEPEQLVDILNRGLEHYSSFQQRTYQIFTDTDTGPSRQHNEDACYPPAGEVVKVEGEEEGPALAIVCDGIGGQESGEVASQLAIETLVGQVNPSSWQEVPQSPFPDPHSLEKAVCAANDAISRRNDSENRENRQRMGTTLVMGLAWGPGIYVVNVGDSRAYWITPTSCHQVTVDDDLASREARLGYLLYRDAIHYPNGGALVQALGMENSSSLHLSVERLIGDEDAVLLLCSDGLSDYDRVEQYWASEIAPILAGEQDVAGAGKRLMEIANRNNGHDNVTVALVYCQVRPKAGIEETPLSFEELQASLPSLSSSVREEASVEREETETSVDRQPGVEQLISSLPNPISPTPAPPSPPQRKSRFLIPLLLTLAVLGLGGMAYGIWWLSYQRNQNPQPVPSYPPVSPSPSESPVITPADLTPGELIKVQGNLPLYSSPQDDLENRLPTSQVPSGTILQLLPVPSNDQPASWLKLQVCQLPSPGATTPDTPDQEGSISLPEEGANGWAKESDLQSSSLTRVPVTPAAQPLGKCSVARPSPEAGLSDGALDKPEQAE